MQNGRVYWITGLNGSGKTTVGTALYYALKEERNNVLILDGDILKQFVGDVVGYTAKERLARAKRYARICKMLADQGMCVIICTISMFDEVRDWNCEHINGYIEIFIDTPPEVLQQRDEQGLYTQYGGELQLPKHPDLVLRNDGTAPISAFVEQIKRLSAKREEDFDRDRSYWNRYYQGHLKEISKPSDFAETIVTGLQPGKHILDLGCGNGRDSLFFLRQGLYVTGVDASDAVIEKLSNLTKDDGRAMFVCDNFVKCSALFQKKYDYIYSRFTLHAITERQEDELFQNLVDALKKDGKLFIEARTIRDDLYGKGEQVASNAFFYDGHFRRFIDPHLLKIKMESLGYHILQMEENRGFSKTATSDPVLLRVTATC